MGKVNISQRFLGLDETIELINSRAHLVIAADETFLEKLPSGYWIGGTIPYFIGDEGGTETKDKAFVNIIEGAERDSRIMMYDERSISSIATDSPSNGFTIVIIPCESKVHQVYAEKAPSFPSMFESPIIGWISGTHLDEVGENSPKTILGMDKSLSSTSAVAIHVPLDENQYATVGIVNAFEQGEEDVLEFPEAGFDVDYCLVNGKESKFSDYLTKNEINTKMPIVANYNGTAVNVSIKSNEDGKVKLYAPVFKNIEYRFAKPISDYVNSFQSSLKSDEDASNSQYSVNCILNYVYSDLQGKKTGPLMGAVTFGEIGYQLLNQTATYLTIGEY